MEAHMAGSSTLDPSNLTGTGNGNPLKGHDAATLGPSDSSDSGSDIAGRDPADDDSDRNGTGERAAVGRKRRTRTDADVDTDHVIDAEDGDPEEAPGSVESAEAPEKRSDRG